MPAPSGRPSCRTLIGEIERSPHRGRLTDVGVVRLPEGKDPDEVIRDDPDAWRAATEQPQPIIEYLIDTYAKRFDTRTIQGRERLVAAVMPTLRSVSDPVRRDGYLQLLSRRSGVEERVLLEELRQPGVGPGRPSSPAPVARAGERQTAPMPVVRDQPRCRPRQPRRARPAGGRAHARAVESALLRLLLRPSLAPARVRDRLPVEAIVTTPARELWRAMLADRDADPDGDFKRDRFLGSLDPTLAGAGPHALCPRRSRARDRGGPRPGASSSACMTPERRR